MARRQLRRAGWTELNERSVAYDEEGAVEGERVAGEVVLFQLKMDQEGVKDCSPDWVQG